MTKIRKDIFPRMSSLLGSREKAVNAWVNEAFGAISAQFNSRDHFVEYINSLKDPETAELFVRICQFYRIAKEYQPKSYVKLIMVISAVERLMSREKQYEEFCFWIEKQESKIAKKLSAVGSINEKDFMKIIRFLRDEIYFKIYGSQRNVVDFFQNHLSIEDKITLIKAIRSNRTKTLPKFSLREYQILSKTSPTPRTIDEASQNTGIRIEERFMPRCYDWKQCQIDYGSCLVADCMLRKAENKPLLDDTLKKVIAHDIYQIRNDFIHSARITPLNEEDSDGFSSIGVFGVIGTKRKPIHIELTSEELQEIFERGLKDYFDRLVN
jgi:hypothetical protein